MGTEANVMAGRLERSARLAATLAESHRCSGEVRTAHELEAFADLFKLSASVIRSLAREADTARALSIPNPLNVSP